MPKIKKSNGDDIDNCESKYWTFTGNSRTEFEYNFEWCENGAFKRFNRRRRNTQNSYLHRLIKAHWIVVVVNPNDRYTGKRVSGYFELEKPVTHRLFVKRLSNTNSNQDFKFTPSEKIDDVPEGYKSQCLINKEK